MYLELFKLQELPFRLSPDPQFLYLSKQHARAKAYMESTIWFTDGFVVITGEIGAGKTTLIETFLRELQSGRGDRANQSDAALPDRVPADGAGAIRLLAFQYEEGRSARDSQPVPDRAVQQPAAKCCSSSTRRKI
jgi:type II secretory pathway predicted ATPase ExeA